MQWDSSRLESITCDLAHAKASRGAIEISFGATHADEDGRALAVRLLQRVSLDPAAAQRLSELLMQLVNEMQKAPTR